MWRQTAASLQCNRSHLRGEEHHTCETELLQQAHPWVGDTICSSVRRRQIIFYTKFAFYLCIIDEDGPDDFVFDVLLFNDDLVNVFPSGAKVLPLGSASR